MKSLIVKRESYKVVEMDRADLLRIQFDFGATTRKITIYSIKGVMPIFATVKRERFFNL